MKPNVHGFAARLKEGTTRWNVMPEMDWHCRLKASSGARIGLSSLSFSRRGAVLEHVNDLEGTYQSLYKWLKPGGIMSHVIDFRCHGCAEQWNGHWSYSDLTWKLIRGKRSFLINRMSHNIHLALLREHGFDVVYELRERATPSSGIDRSRLAPAFQDISDEDLQTRGAFIQAVKK